MIIIETDRKVNDGELFECNPRSILKRERLINIRPTATPDKYKMAQPDSKTAFNGARK
jgi:hypothetical protein